MSIRVEGKIISAGMDIMYNHLVVGRQAEIELPEVDVSKIKAGDEMWVRMIVPAENNYKTTFMTKHSGKFVYHIPQPEKEKKIEKANLPCFVQDYFMRGENKFIGEALQCLNDHLGMLESKLNEVIERVNCVTCGDKVTDCHCKERV